MKINLSHLAPCGFEAKKQLKTFGVMYGFSFLYSFCSIIGKIDYEYRSLQWHNYSEEWKAEPLYVLLENNLILFTVTAIVMLAFALFYYLSHFQGSKSIYLMRRLPRRGELAKRCLVLPIFLFAVVVLTAAALLGLYYAYYIFRIPAQYCAPNQWVNVVNNIWSVII